MITRFYLGTQKKAAAFRAKVITNGFRSDEQCEVLSNNLCTSMQNCLIAAREEVGYSDHRMEGAIDKSFDCPEIIDFECSRQKNGRILCIVRWNTANVLRENDSIISHDNGKKFAIAMCEYVKSYISQARNGETNARWLLKIDLKTEGFSQ